MIKKSSLTALVLCLLALSLGPSAQSSVAAGSQSLPMRAGLFLNVFPVLDFTTRPVITSTISDADLGWYYEKPTFVSGGIYLSAGGASLVGAMEFQQDIWSKLAKQSWINLPDSETGWAPDVIGLGTFYPNIGYAAWENDRFRFSFGRRKIKSGPGTYGLGISSGNPFYDHAAASFAIPTAKGKLAYDYVAVGLQRWWNTVSPAAGTQPKYLFFHRGSWTAPRFAIGLSEYNMLSDVYPDFQDFSPFAFYHNFFNNHHNVMIGVDITAKPLDSLSLYGEWVMDDFQIGAEGGNPNAMGFMAGAEWRAIPGRAEQKPKFFDSEYVYDLFRAEKADGLAIRAEAYLASTYLWRRNITAASEAFTSRYHIMSNWSNGYHLVEPFLASPLGPDTFLGRLAASWREGRVDASVSVEYRIKGSQSETKTYNVLTLDPSAWLWPSAPATTEIAVQMEGSYLLDRLSIVTAGATVLFKPADADVSLSLGYGRRVGTGPLTD